MFCERVGTSTAISKRRLRTFSSLCQVCKRRLATGTYHENADVYKYAVFREHFSVSRDDLYLYSMLTNGKLILEELSQMTRNERCFPNEIERQKLKMAINHLLGKFNAELRIIEKHCGQLTIPRTVASRRKSVCIANAGRYLRLVANSGSTGHSALWRHHHRHGHKRFLTCQGET